jgi:hypothetical protein
MAAGWIANLVAVLDQDSVPSRRGEVGTQDDIDVLLGNASTEFTAEVNYLDYLATLRIGLVETGDGESVSVCIDCLPDADKRSACEKAIASRGMTFAREGVDVRVDFALDDFFELKAQRDGVSDAGELVRAVGLVVQSLGEVLEEMDELWDPFEGPYEFVDDDALSEEIRHQQRAAILREELLSEADDGKGGGLDELLG